MIADIEINLPPLTFGKLVNGFEAWYAEHGKILVPIYETEADKEEFETFEDFAVEVYLDIKLEMV